MSRSNRGKLSPGGRDPSAMIRGAIAPVVLVVLAVAAYFPVWTAEYIQDDHIAVEKNAIVERGDLREIFTTDYWAGAEGEDKSLYRPVTILSYAMERMADRRASPLVSHGVNLALHILTSLAVLALATGLGAGRMASATAAILFAMHPVHVEAVAGIVGRAEILATLFTVCALVLYARTDPEINGAAAARLGAWGAAACFFLALCSKEVGLACAPLLLAMNLLFFERRSLSLRAHLVRRAATLVPSVLAGLLYVMLRINALEAFPGTQSPHPVDNPLLLLEYPGRLLTALALLARYLRVLVFPVGLSADYSGGVIEAESTLLAVLPLVGLVVLSGLLVASILPFLPGKVNRSAPSRLRSFVALAFLCPYLIVGNLVILVGSIFAERFLYLPSVAFCITTGIFLDFLAYRYPAFRQWSPAQRARYAVTIGAVLIAAFAFLTWSRASIWQNDETVFRDAARAQPKSPRAHFILGSLAADAGRIEEALDMFHRASELSPLFVPSFTQSGILLARRDRLKEAEERLRTAVRLAPANVGAHFNLGLVLRRQARIIEAEREIRKALAHEPEFAKAWTELGNIQAATGREAEAVESYRNAVSLGRTDLIPRIEALEEKP